MHKKINFLKRKIQKVFVSTEFFFIILLIFTAVSSFFLGKISEKIKINTSKNTEIKLLSETNASQIKLVASKKGKKYHLPWCSGALSMSAKNKIYFNNKTEAEKAGYTPAKNCEGL